MYLVRNITDRIPGRGYSHGVQVEGKFINPGNFRNFVSITEGTRRLEKKRIRVENKDYPIIEIIPTADPVSLKSQMPQTSAMPAKAANDASTTSAKAANDAGINSVKAQLVEKAQSDDKALKAEKAKNDSELAERQAKEAALSEPLKAEELPELVAGFDKVEYAEDNKTTITEETITPPAPVVETAPINADAPAEPKDDAPDIKVPVKMTKKRGRPRKNPVAK